MSAPPRRSEWKGRARRRTALPSMCTLQSHTAGLHRPADAPGCQRWRHRILAHAHGTGNESGLRHMSVQDLRWRARRTFVVSADQSTHKRRKPLNAIVKASVARFKSRDRTVHTKPRSVQKEYSLPRNESKFATCSYWRSCSSSDRPSVSCSRLREVKQERSHIILLLKVTTSRLTLAAPRTQPLLLCLRPIAQSPSRML